MLSGKGAVELLKVETTEPEEFQSIVSQQLSEKLLAQFHRRLLPKIPRF